MSDVTHFFSSPPASRRILLVSAGCLHSVAPGNQTTSEYIIFCRQQVWHLFGKQLCAVEPTPNLLRELVVVASPGEFVLVLGALLVLPRLLSQRLASLLRRQLDLLRLHPLYVDLCLLQKSNQVEKTFPTDTDGHTGRARWRGETLSALSVEKHPRTAHATFCLGVTIAQIFHGTKVSRTCRNTQTTWLKHQCGKKPAPSLCFVIFARRLV